MRSALSALVDIGALYIVMEAKVKKEWLQKLQITLQEMRTMMQEKGLWNLRTMRARILKDVNETDCPCPMCVTMLGARLAAIDCIDTMKAGTPEQRRMMALHIMYILDSVDSLFIDLRKALRREGNEIPAVRVVDINDVMRLFYPPDDPPSSSDPNVN